jgi:hypothetical protein
VGVLTVDNSEASRLAAVEEWGKYDRLAQKTLRAVKVPGIKIGSSAPHLVVLK